MDINKFFESYKEADDLVDFHFAHEVIGQKVEVIQTGSLSLDDALSSGGLPKGRIIQYYGGGGSGKTMMTLIAIRNAQAEDSAAYQVFIDAEGTFSSSWAETLGCDTSKIIVIEGDKAVNGRKCFELLLGIPKEDKKHILVGKSKEGLLDKIANEEININLIVLDSLGAIIPPGEDTSEVGKMNMSLLARFLTTTFRKLSLEVKKANIPFVVINHMKDGMDPYGPAHTYSGGNSYRHFLSANVFFDPVRSKDAIIFDEKENKVGHLIRATIEKSKFGPWPRKCEFKVNFGIGVVDQHEEIAQLALDYDVVTKPTSMTHEYGERKWVGGPKYIEGIKNDPELAQELVNKISEARDKKWEKKRVEQEEKKASSTVEGLDEIVGKTKRKKKEEKNESSSDAE